jgi:hypothetical protein
MNDSFAVFIFLSLCAATLLADPSPRSSPFQNGHAKLRMTQARSGTTRPRRLSRSRPVQLTPRSVRPLTPYFARCLGSM